MDVFETILRSDLPSEEKATWRLAQEASLIIAAGTETTAWVQSVIIFHLLSNRQVLGKLLQELNGAMADKSSLPPVHQLEQLPYLISSILSILFGRINLAADIPKQRRCLRRPPPRHWGVFKAGTSRSNRDDDPEDIISPWWRGCVGNPRRYSGQYDGLVDSHESRALSRP